MARDMMQIVDALDEDGLLRYWGKSTPIAVGKSAVSNIVTLGVSGGTTLGATVAAMFPDRMDKVLLDGVINSHQYYNG